MKSNCGVNYHHYRLPMESHTISSIWSRTAHAVLNDSTICVTCRELFTWRIADGESQGIVQTRSTEDVEESADQGCNLCKSLSYGANQGYISHPSPHRLIGLSTSKGFPQLDINKTSSFPPSNVRQHDIIFQVDGLHQKGIIGPHSLSQRSLTFVSGLIDQCTSTHQICGKGDESLLPKRIIYIGSKSSQLIKLVENSRVRARYACLSHCWGNTKSIESTKTNIDDHKSNLSWDSLPKTYRDAITFCWELNIQYLWIDALCIIQDDVYDWQEESSKMASIYENCFITLAATGAPNHESPCATQLAPQHHLKEIGRICPDNSSTTFPILVREALPHPYTIAKRTPFRINREAFPLLSRAWVFQERMLSPRVLHFLPNELMLECKHGVECECQHINPSETISKTHVFGASGTQFYKEKCAQCEVAKRWGRILNSYTELDLTFPKDRLPAISGLARRMQQTRSDRYLAGIWENDMPPALFWGSPYNRARRGCLPRPEDSGAPTWSWGSIASNHCRGFEPHKCPKCAEFVGQIFPVKFIRADVRPATIDPYGPTKPPAEVTISAKVSPGTLRYGVYEHYVVYPKIMVMEEVAFCPDYDFRYPGKYQVQDGAALICIYHDIVSKGLVDFLILRVIDEQNERYQRLGFGSVYNDEAIKLKEMDSKIPFLTKTITLV